MKKNKLIRGFIVLYLFSGILNLCAYSYMYNTCWNNNKKNIKNLNIINWHNKEIKGEGVKIAVIGYGAIMYDKKQYVTNVNNPNGNGSYHDGDELINQVAPNSKIYSINIFEKGWSFEDALKWTLDNDIDVICTSISLSYWDEERETLSKELYEKDVIMIDSSDNQGKEDSIEYPAKSQYWYAVGAYEKNKRADYSSYGSEMDILGYTGFMVHKDEKYTLPITHTSGATQVVSGMVALLKQAYKIDNEQFKLYIKENSLDLGPKGWDKETGWGLFKLEQNPNIEKIDN